MSDLTVPSGILVTVPVADLRHHVDVNVHPKLRFEIYAQGPRTARYAQEVRLLGMRQRDVFEREIAADGSITDTSVEGFNKGGAMTFRFVPEHRDGRSGTRVEAHIRLPMPAALAWLRRLLEAQVRREVRAAFAEDRHDIEVRGYRPQAPAAAVRLAA